MEEQKKTGVIGEDGRIQCPDCGAIRLQRSYGGSWQCINGHRFDPPPDVPREGESNHD